MSNLEKSILATLSWFDIFDYPLTILELWNWQIKDRPSEGHSFQEIFLLLEAGTLSRYVSSQNGLYFLKGREKIIETRITRYKIAAQKIKIARQAARIFAFLPFIRLMAICNSLGLQNADKNSDIDFFIITEKQRIFFVRFLIAGIATLLRLRPSSLGEKDKLCFSFFISNTSLDISHLKHPKLRVSWPYDLYLHFWSHQLIPLFEERNTYQMFISKNTWVREMLPLSNPPLTTERLGIFYSRFFCWLRSVFEKLFSGKLGSLIEYWLKGIQRRKLPEILREKIGQGTDVMFTPHVLKFHSNDRRVFFQETFLEKYQGIVR